MLDILYIFGLLQLCSEFAIFEYLKSYWRFMECKNKRRSETMTLFDTGQKKKFDCKKIRAILLYNLLPFAFRVRVCNYDIKHKEVMHCMPSVRVKADEPFDVILRRFRRACEKAGIFSEIRRREYYEKPTTVRKRKNAAAVKREKKRTMRQQGYRARQY